MKNLIFLILLCAATSLSAQNALHLADLEKLAPYSFKEFDTYTLRNGYAALKSANEKTLKYVSTDGEEGKKNKLIMSKDEDGEMLFFMTYDTTYHSTIKNELKAAGYKEESPVKSSDGKSEYPNFSKGRYTVLLKVSVDKNGNQLYTTVVSKG